MTNTVEEFVGQLSAESQELIENKLFTKNNLDNYIFDHQGKFLINDPGYLLSPINEERIIGELNSSEIELAIIVEDVFLRYLKEQKDSIRYFKDTLECMDGCGEREMGEAQKYLLDLNNRLQVLYKEHDNTANYVNSLISLRLKKEIDILLEKDSSIDKHVYCYNAYIKSWSGYAFRVCNGNKILLDNQCIPGGD